MGMSASQARLLSITARLTNNEFRAQTITDRKLRLADDSSYASQEYMDALNSQKLVFGDYSSGSVQYNPLTAGLLYTYAPLKNQYALRDASGKALVSALDARNFEETNSLSEFLGRYDLVDTYTDYTEYNREMDIYKQNMEEYSRKKQAYDNDMLDYQSKLQQYNSESAHYNEEKAKYDAEYQKYMEEYLEWVKNKQDTGLYDLFSGAVGTSDMKDGPEPTESSKQCYWHALQARDTNDCSCYAHVLLHILDYNGTNSGNNGNDGHYTTSYGEDIQILLGSSGYMVHSCDDVMVKVSDAINEKDSSGEYIRKCDGTDDYTNRTGVKNMLEKAISDYKSGKISDTEYKLYILLSDFVDNGDGTYSIKSLKQKAVDLMYVSMHWGPAGYGNEFTEDMLSRETMVDMLINFTDGDMRKLSDEPKKPEFDLEMPTPPTAPEKPEEPEMPTPPEPSFAVRDREKCQWYTNLWNMMNGSDSANVVQDAITIEDNKFGEQAAQDVNEVLYKLADITKNTSRVNYKAIEDNLLYSDEWLEFALEHGIVTMTQAQYFNPSDDSSKSPEITAEGFMWKSIIYTNASDIISQEDDVAIARAEAKYKKTMNKIEAQDNKYDRDLKKLDTEHTALQTEYDSIKEVISKNVERSFKAFS